MTIPPIGQVVLRRVGTEWRRDWVAQVRLGDEQFVLVWGSDRRRFNLKDGDAWRIE